MIRRILEPIISLPVENLLAGTTAGSILAVVSHGFSVPVFVDMTLTTAPKLDAVELRAKGSVQVQSLCAAGGTTLANKTVQDALTLSGLVTESKFFREDILSSSIPCELDIVMYN